MQPPRRGTPRIVALPHVAPRDSCVVCFRGDTTTRLALAGEAEFTAAALVVVGVPNAQATALVEMIATRDYGCAPGEVPDEMEGVFRVRADCAARGRVEAHAEGEMLLYRQPPEMRRRNNS